MKLDLGTFVMFVFLVFTLFTKTFGIYIIHTDGQSNWQSHQLWQEGEQADLPTSFIQPLQ